MISRNVLEGLIVKELVAIRQAETELSGRYAQLALTSDRAQVPDVLCSLAQLDERADRLEWMIEALGSSSEGHAEAA